MFIRQLFDRETSTLTYLLADLRTREAALIDPVFEQVGRDLKLIDELGLTLKWVMDSHVHADHITGAGELRKRTGAKTAASPKGAPCVDVQLKHGDRLQLGDETIEVLSTPGHTDDGLSFWVAGHVFTGDTLFVRGTGRSDFQNGSSVDLYRSITTVLFTLPDDTVVWPGHDYRGYTASTIGEEKRLNPRVAGKTEEEFSRLMAELDLPRPANIDSAVPANRACGLFVSVEEASSPQEERAGAAISEVTPSEVSGELANFRLIDVREPHEFSGELGHVAGAELVPLSTVVSRSGAWPKSAPILCICRSGGRSAVAGRNLIEQGFTNVKNLTGGMLAWNEAKLPVLRSPS